MGPGEIINTTVSMIEQFNNWRQMRKDIDAVIRLLYLESARNINLLEALNYEGKSLKSDDDAYKKAALLLETEILNMIFLEGKKSSRIFKIMEKMSDIELEDEDGTSETEKRHTLNALSFIYIKIWTLKKLVQLETKGKALKSIRYRNRMKNILSAYHSVLRNLKDMDEIAPLLQEKD